MFSFHTNHKFLLVTIGLVFAGLSVLIAILPAYTLQENNNPLPGDRPPTSEEIKGLAVYIEEGCVACHTQQVRNIEMDNVWGSRPSMPADYYYSKQRMSFWQQSPSLLGSERTGPDLTNIGKRQPSQDWHLLHLYNPRLVVSESVMPAYPWLFEEKSNPDGDDIVVNVPEDYTGDPSKKVVASAKALHLVAYLKSLKQTEIANTPAFIPAKEKKSGTATSAEEDPGEGAVDGKQLYVTNCSACHQQNGEGLAGAFPSLKGSSIVNDEDPETLIRIILRGYDARQEYGVMPGFADRLSDEEIAAIATHERNSWGNSAGKIDAEQVAKIRKIVETETVQ